MQFSTLAATLLLTVYNVNAAATLKDGCDALKCVTAYAGEIAACSSAAAQLGVDIPNDIACFAAVAGAESVAPICAACI